MSLDVYLTGEPETVECEENPDANVSVSR